MRQDPAAAQKLVSAGSSTSSAQNKENEKEAEADPDLQRAKDLVDLHGNVKVKLEEQGLDHELEGLREKVEALVGELDRR